MIGIEQITKILGTNNIYALIGFLIIVIINGYLIIDKRNRNNVVKNITGKAGEIITANDRFHVSLNYIKKSMISSLNSSGVSSHSLSSFSFELYFFLRRSESNSKTSSGLPIICIS